MNASWSRGLDSLVLQDGVLTVSYHGGSQAFVGGDLTLESAEIVAATLGFTRDEAEVSA